MKKIYILPLLILFLVFLFSINNFTNAQADAQGLVPCGGSSGIPCKLCHFFVMLEKIFDFVIQIVGVVAVLMFVISGINFLFAGSDPGRLNNAKKILTSTVMGLIIIFGAWLIINIILSESTGFVNPSFGFNDWYNPAAWFEATCP